MNLWDPEGLRSCLLGACASTQQAVVDAAAGFGDGASEFLWGWTGLPTTRDIRGKLGIDHVDVCSTAYAGGGLAGSVATLPAGGSGVLAVIVTGKVTRIAARLGRGRKEVARAIERVKQRGLPRGNNPRNPDVGVDDATGEVYPIRPDGSYGDSIGNVYDHMP